MKTKLILSDWNTEQIYEQVFDYILPVHDGMFFYIDGMRLTVSNIENHIENGQVTVCVYFGTTDQPIKGNWKEICICKEPTTPDVVHRTDGPCFRKTA